MVVRSREVKLSAPVMHCRPLPRAHRNGLECLMGWHGQVSRHEMGNLTNLGLPHEWSTTVQTGLWKCIVSHQNG